jgi:hypothetical protein
MERNSNEKREEAKIKINENEVDEMVSRNQIKSFQIYSKNIVYLSQEFDTGSEFFLLQFTW